MADYVLILNFVIHDTTRHTDDYFSRGSCLIFMPRLELWATESSHGGQTLEHDDDTHQTASSAWNLFIDQVESLFLSTPFIFLVKPNFPMLLSLISSSYQLNCF